MPVRRREAPCATYGVVPYFWKIKNTSLVALGALTVARSWTGVQSFAVPIGGGIHATGTCTTSGAPAPAVASTRTTAAARSRSPLRRYRQGLRERRSGAGLVVVKASLDDDVDDEFDPNAWADDLEDDEEEDMGMGVSNTIKNRRKTPDPKYVNAEYAENVILELATATQNVLDNIVEEENELEEQERAARESVFAAAAAAAAATGVDDEDGNDLGMGVSESVPPPKSMVETFGGQGGRFGEVLSTMQGVEELREMEEMTARDQKRVEMEQRGLSEEQIKAYLGDVKFANPPMSRAEEAKAREDEVNARAFEKFNQAAFVDSSSWRAEEALLKVAPSSTLVKTDANGEPLEDRFVYVDEYTCIGCTHCNHEAPSTFFMEEDHGRARVYQQGRDTDDAVRTAILTCPVDCIHYVDWPELVRLEKERDGIEINFKAKLVGNDHDNAANGMQTISGNQGMRCENCPSRGCYACPMFGVGNNPDYTKRKAERKAKRMALRRKEKEELSGEIKTAEL